MKTIEKTAREILAEVRGERDKVAEHAKKVKDLAMRELMPLRDLVEAICIQSYVDAYGHYDRDDKHDRDAVHVATDMTDLTENVYMLKPSNPRIATLRVWFENNEAAVQKRGDTYHIYYEFSRDRGYEEVASADSLKGAAKAVAVALRLDDHGRN